MFRRIAVVSGKGGVGKSTIAAGISTALSKFGKKVLLVDCDVCADTQKLFFKVESDAVFNLGDLMADRCDLRSAVVTPEGMKVDIITPPTDFKDTEFITFFKNLMIELENVYDFVIIDAPSGMDSGYKLALSGADCAIIVSTEDKPSVAFAEKVSLDLEKKSVPKCLVINKITAKRKRQRDVDVDDIVNQVSSRLIGLLPAFDSSSVRDITKMAEDKFSSHYFNNIALRLMGEYVKAGLPAEY